MMPLDELDLILDLTNEILESSRKKELSFQELLLLVWRDSSNVCIKF